jgi:hypothetical protein
LPEVDLVPSVFAGKVWVAGEPGSRGGKLIDRAVISSHLVDPPHHIFAPIAPGRSPTPGNAEVDLSSTLVEFLGDLAAGLP